MPVGEYSKDMFMDTRAFAFHIFHEAISMWSGLVSIALVAFLVFSSFHFSFLLTLSSLVSSASFVMMAVIILRRKSVAGVSKKMMDCYVIVYLARLVAIVPVHGYLLQDDSGDWLYQSCESLGLAGAAFISFCCRRLYAGTQDVEVDNCFTMLLMLATFGLALVLHADLAGHMLCDIAWAFALYLEAVAVLPQLFMFIEHKSTRPHTPHFLAAQALSKLTSLAFWVCSMSDLGDPEHPIYKYTGHWVVLVQLIQIIIMSDFIYHYVRCLRKKIPVSEMMQVDV